MDNGIDRIVTAPQPLQLKAGATVSDKEQVAIRKAAREFEGLLVGMMLKSMRETVGKDMLAGKGQSEEIYRSLLDQEYAKGVVEHGGLGLAKVIEAQLIGQSAGSPRSGAQQEPAKHPSSVGE